MDFRGKRALVTGGTSGIGKAIAEMLLNMKAEVYITGKRETSLYNNFYSVDFSSDISVKSFLKQIENIDFDILINNAGINKIDFLSDLQREDFEKILKVNTQTPLFLMKHICGKMKKKKYGRVVNISSIYGNISREKRISYSCSKFALKGITKAISLEMAKYNVLVNSVSPVFTDTELTRKILSAKEIEELEKTIPIGRLAQTREISNLICFLASDLNTYICGQDYIIDGGYCCG